MSMVSMEFNDHVNPFSQILVLGDPHITRINGEFIIMSMFVIESLYKCPWFPWSYNINAHGFFVIIILKSMVSVEVLY
jgi:hypothetical protein